jgi:hypothetical protein
MIAWRVGLRQANNRTDWSGMEDKMGGTEGTFPDIGSMSNQDLKDLIAQLTGEEREVSYRRRLLHGKIDILRAELVNRLRTKRESGDTMITGDDVQRLTDILSGNVKREERAPKAAGSQGQ